MYPVLLGNRDFQCLCKALDHKCNELNLHSFNDKQRVKSEGNVITLASYYNLLLFKNALKLMITAVNTVFTGHYH